MHTGGLCLCWLMDFGRGWAPISSCRCLGSGVDLVSSGTLCKQLQEAIVFHSAEKGESVGLRASRGTHSVAGESEKTHATWEGEPSPGVWLLL